MQVGDYTNVVFLEVPNHVTFYLIICRSICSLRDVELVVMSLIKKGSSIEELDQIWIPADEIVIAI